MYNKIEINKLPREGWDVLFEQMHKNGDDQLIIDDVLIEDFFDESVD